MTEDERQESGEWLGTDNVGLIESWIARLGLPYVLAQRPDLSAPTAAETGSPHTQACVVKQRGRLWNEYACNVYDKGMSGVSYECQCGGVEYRFCAKAKEEEHGIVVDVGWVRDAGA